jgi:hypothetical protein
VRGGVGGQMAIRKCFRLLSAVKCVQRPAMDWTTGILFLLRAKIFIITVHRQALEPTQLPIQWGYIPGIKQPEYEADHSLPCSAEVKDALSYTSSHPYTFMLWCLINH